MRSCTVYSIGYILFGMATTKYCKVHINELVVMFTV